MGKKHDKTNVMRILDRAKVEYEYFEYDNSKLNAVEVANELKIGVGCLFKTLVTVGKSREHYVFMVPAAEELDLKKAAKCAGEKSVEMLRQKELLPLTGYIHGGCSPIGMKKQFKTFIHKTAVGCGKLYFSAGKVGHQVSLSFDDLQKVIPITAEDIIKA
ncbi:MAG: aminoacyl-tRNA deacylase [Ruminococcus sp.]|nr:aminoacyl-tRNA deacylase [Ruminococcus sp.]